MQKSEVNPLAKQLVDFKSNYENCYSDAAIYGGAGVGSHEACWIIRSHPNVLMVFSAVNGSQPATGDLF